MKSISDELDEIVSSLLGEYHNHLCLTCEGKKPEDCINCRKTGYNQTPCLICDKDGIAFKNKKLAKQAILNLIEHERVEAMKSELEWILYKFKIRSEEQYPDILPFLEDRLAQFREGEE